MLPGHDLINLNGSFLLLFGMNPKYHGFLVSTTFTMIHYFLSKSKIPFPCLLYLFILSTTSKIAPESLLFPLDTRRGVALYKTITIKRNHMCFTSFKNMLFTFVTHLHLLAFKLCIGSCNSNDLVVVLPDLGLWVPPKHLVDSKGDIGSA